MRFILLLLWGFYLSAYALPDNFVYLHDTAPDIIEDIRYANNNNFVGNPIPGYLAPRCILTRAAANQLQKAQFAIARQGYRLKVYDCYRPQMAVNAFNLWSKDLNDTRMKQRFYPHEPKKTLFEKGYIAHYSGHSRGSTVDITLVKDNKINRTTKTAASQKIHSIDMGTPFDYFDESAHVFHQGVSKQQLKNRLLLRQLMKTYGFKPYSKEWWHFTLENEPYPRTYFNFPVQ
ncbi:M15 family metallopeptidase [Legionella nagasakiensis]|uniref:M15 family metallopeptidase n=1 Tax=Legionella nagasakiensis TaxID=535290 RepID=UPI001056C001|nr:M15 family metallopeptidase [Legionella nagasakiensis]